MLPRKPNKNDIAQINNINSQQDFKLDNFDNCIIESVVDNGDGKILAYGIVKDLAEAIFLVDLTLPTITRAKAMQELMQIALFGTARKNIKQLHVFVKDRELANSLIKHFNFIESKDIILVRNI